MTIFDKIIDYFRSSKNELTKVSWPSKQDTIRYSTLVIGISVGVAVFFGVLDMGLSRLVTASLANKQATAPVSAQTTPITPITQPVTTEQPKIDYTNVTPITPTDNTKK
ncbi:MAG: preprotein translocase subunit SecE [Patescibacteria group bacterium]